MNYLVHFLLAGDDDELRLGNVLGDFVKGRVERFEHRGLTERLRTGIQLHRTIDAFSDRHPAVLRSKLPFSIKLKYLFNPPGWSHDGSSKTARELRKEWSASRMRND